MHDEWWKFVFVLYLIFSVCRFASRVIHASLKVLEFEFVNF